MTCNESELMEPYDDGVARFLSEKEIAAPMFIIAIDENGQAQRFAAPGREFRRIPVDQVVDATSVGRLTCATWVIYTNSPNRSRNCIGGDCYDGG